MSGGDQRTYSCGATQIIVATGATATLVSAGQFVNGWLFKKISGGTLAVVNSFGMTAAQGYIVGDTEPVSIMGPASFYLAAGGATTIVGVISSKSANT